MLHALADLIRSPALIRPPDLIRPRASRFRLASVQGGLCRWFVPRLARRRGGTGFAVAAAPKGIGERTKAHVGRRTALLCPREGLQLAGPWTHRQTWIPCRDTFPPIVPAYRLNRPLWHSGEGAEEIVGGHTERCPAGRHIRRKVNRADARSTLPADNQV